MTDNYAVFGNPVAHSKSPQIHAMFAAQTGEDIAYDRVLAPLKDFPGTVRHFVRRGGRGFNVTLPFKEEAWRMVRRRSARAEKAGAVNTVSVADDGYLTGDNTDGAGLVRDITHNLGWPLRGQRVLVIGAGGAVRGVLSPLLAEQPKVVVIANRTAEKAEKLAALFGDEGAISGGGFPALADAQPFDLVINGSSASLGGELPPVPAHVIGPHTRCYDMMYARQETVFNRWAREQGAAVCADGLGMLVEQAAEAFFGWRGKRPDTGPVLVAMRRG
ncbi:MAG: shikimate dehydrogenase [Pseudomonadota bacterium]